MADHNINIDLSCIDLSRYPNLPEFITKGKTPEEIEAMKERIRNHTFQQILYPEGKNNG